MNMIGSFFLTMTFCISGFTNTQSYEAELIQWQQELNALFLDEEESPLDKKARKKFKGLDFFPIDPTYRVTAAFLRTPNELPFNMPTTTERLPVYVKYGEAIFDLQGQSFNLPLYKSQMLMDTGNMEEYLFLPFTDQTNGIETYGGGRYIDLKVPEDDEIVIDFNKAYNPYCAYNSSYSCPVPPKANDLNIAIKAGVKSSNK